MSEPISSPPVSREPACPKCGAPAQASGGELVTPDLTAPYRINPRWRFDGEQFLKEKIAALTDGELEAAANRAAKTLYPEGIGFWNRARWLRVAISEALGVSASGGSPE